MLEFLLFIKPLSSVPEGNEDEAMASVHFAEGFTRRYGHRHPIFFQGTLDDAIKEACLQPIREVCKQNYLTYF